MALVWTILPLEIRLEILENVARDYRLNHERPYIRAGYASVCREWQSFFEELNFHSLVLDQDRTMGLEEFMSHKSNIHRRNYCYRVSLCVRLDEYNCEVCHSEEDDATRHSNNYVFTRAIYNLLIILSRWKALTRLCGSGRSQEQGLVLELGVYSPSDHKHVFRDFNFQHNYPSWGEKLERHPRSYEGDCKYLTRLHCAWMNDSRYTGSVFGQSRFLNTVRGAMSIDCGSKQRITGTLNALPINSGDGKTLKFPQVDIVRGLFVQRQSCRRIAPESIGELLALSFTCLEWFRDEGWSNPDHFVQLDFERGYERRVRHNKLPSTLRNLFIFEDFNALLNPDRYYGYDFPTRVLPSLGIALSTASRSLENLSIAFQVDAVHFFSEFWPDKHLNPEAIVPWKNLRTLALTTHLLRQNAYREEMNMLLRAAGRAAAFMPKLEVMEIWNGTHPPDGGFSIIWRYQSSNDKSEVPDANRAWMTSDIRSSGEANRARITVLTDWGDSWRELPCDPATDNNCWLNSFQLHSPQAKLEVTRLRMPFTKPEGWLPPESFADVIPSLILRDNVLHGLSEQQLAQEEDEPAPE